jgi:Txe/YoeB family toxin of Txe-Axe toxin-antitoxin module
MIYKINILKNADEDLRVNLTDRMVYTIYENKKEIDVTSFKGHYEK